MNYLLEMIIEKLYIPENDMEYTILIGRNAKENTSIIKIANQNDTWFHLENMSSAHIILQNNGDIIPKRYINLVAAKLFLYKKSCKSNVIYTTIQNVICTSTPGQVTLKKYNTIKF